MQKIALKYGFMMFISLVLLFAVIHLIGLSQNLHLRVLNGFVHLAFLHLTIKDYRDSNPSSINNYISGVAVGTYMTMVAVILFASAMMLYLTFDTVFFESLKSNFPYPDSFTPFSASLGIIVEGLAASVIGAYIITRLIDGFLEDSVKGH